MREIFPALEEPFFHIHRDFDGFEPWNLDGASVIEIWGIDKIISEAISSKYESIDCIAFGDFMLGSEHICCLANNLESPIFYDESKENISDSYFDFWRKFCSGELDFL
jgi:hypothetical protein